MSRPRTRRRWPRLAIPFGVALLLVVLSTIAYAMQQPSVTDPAYLSPRDTGGLGASRLADRLDQRGIPVRRVTKSSDALAAAHRGDVTLLLPTPSLMHPFYLRMLKLLPASTRVVLVAPTERTLAAGLIPVGQSDRRLAAKAVPPGCAFPPAVAAGVAGVGRARFTALRPGAGAAELYRCYGGAIVGYRRSAAEVTVVGAADPFRNDRIDEHGNAELAVGLLARAPQLVWLDLHQPEPAPGYVDNPALASAPPAPPSLGPGSPDPDFPLPDGAEEGSEQRPGRPESAGGGGQNPLWSAFPPWTFAVAALLALAAVLLAVSRARRLATPIAEPLPIAVRATETVEGRGRLYQRAKAREPALETLRAAARQRLTGLLGLPADAAAAELVAAVAGQSGWAPEAVEAVLYATEPSADADLVAAAVALDALTHAVARPAPPRNAVPEGELR